jgi:hypothetical protein
MNLFIKLLSKIADIIIKIADIITSVITGIYNVIATALKHVICFFMLIAFCMGPWLLILSLFHALTPALIITGLIFAILGSVFAVVSAYSDGELK